MIFSKKYNLQYKIVGKGKKKLILIHGFLENMEMWNFILSNLVEKHQVLVVDLIGHGKSKDLEMTSSLDYLADEFLEIIYKEKLRGVVLFVIQWAVI